MEAKVEVEILKLIREVSTKQDKISKALTDHVNKEEGDWNDMKTSLESLVNAFPNKDTIGHHDYHATLIERNLWITSICKDVTKEIAKYGLLGFLAWLGYQAWTGFLAGPMK